MTDEDGGFNRDFLLFMPNDNHANAHTTLHTVLSFYSDVMVLNPEGDSIITEETLEGLGTTSTSLLQVIFGSIFRLASPPELQGPRPGLRDDPPTTASEPSSDTASSPATARHVLAQHPSLDAPLPGSPAGVDYAASATEPLTPYPNADQTANQLLGIRPGMPEQAQVEEFWLIRYLPQIGYYIAGAAAGGISRTATAPLDRLKVYLLVNTKSDTHAAVDAVKTARPVDAIRSFSRSLSRAMTQLYTEGGLRGFWAGGCSPGLRSRLLDDRAAVDPVDRKRTQRRQDHARNGNTSKFPSSLPFGLTLAGPQKPSDADASAVWHVRGRQESACWIGRPR